MSDNKVRFTFRLPKHLLIRLKEISNEKGVSVNTLVLQSLWAWMEKNDNKEVGRFEKS